MFRLGCFICVICDPTHTNENCRCVASSTVVFVSHNNEYRLTYRWRSTRQQKLQCVVTVFYWAIDIVDIIINKWQLNVNIVAIRSIGVGLFALEKNLPEISQNMFRFKEYCLFGVGYSTYLLYSTFLYIWRQNDWWFELSYLWMFRFVI